MAHYRAPVTAHTYTFLHATVFVAVADIRAVVVRAGSAVSHGRSGAERDHARAAERAPQVPVARSARGPRAVDPRRRSGGRVSGGATGAHRLRARRRRW